MRWSERCCEIADDEENDMRDDDEGLVWLCPIAVLRFSLGRAVQARRSIQIERGKRIDLYEVIDRRCRWELVVKGEEWMQQWRGTLYPVTGCLSNEEARFIEILSLAEDGYSLR
jgi:hypothetical protein